MSPTHAALVALADEWNAVSRQTFAEATSHEDRVTRLFAATERDLCAAQLRAFAASLASPEAREGDRYEGRTAQEWYEAHVEWRELYLDLKAKDEQP